jgi:Tol biopolymer transport system component
MGWRNTTVQALKVSYYSYAQSVLIPRASERMVTAFVRSTEHEVDDNTAGAVFSVSQSCELTYLSGSQKGAMYYMWLDANGKPLSQATQLGVYGGVRISPDGSKFATQVYRQNGGIDIAIWDQAGGTNTKIASGQYTDTPVWSPDGSTLYYAYSGDENSAKIYKRLVDGSRVQQAVIPTQGETFPVDVSRDGKWLLYQETLHDARQFSALRALPLIGGGQPVTVVERIDQLSSAALMPGDNEWLAYQSSDSGRAEIYLTRFPNAGPKYQVSLGGGVMPVWSKDGSVPGMAFSRTTRETLNKPEPSRYQVFLPSRCERSDSVFSRS